MDGVEVGRFSELAGISSEVEPVDRRLPGTLTMYATDGTATAKYYLESAWPSKVEISALKAGASEVLYETGHVDS